MTFDDILPAIQKILDDHRGVTELDWLLINRDLNGRVRFIAPQTAQDNVTQRMALDALTADVAERLGAHAYPRDLAILYEADREASAGAASVPLDGHPNVWVVDRLATEGNWAQISPETQGPPRVVFFSIKGGVGRSTALAACAWKLAQSGKKVLVLDMDLESPGLSSSLLPPERRPEYGVTDWLVEDLVDNAGVVLDDIVAISELSREGQIFVVPAHGADAGEYIAKLGRVWMPKIRPDGTRESWSMRLQRLLQALEQRIQPDIVLIDSRAGIDEVASACVTDLGANLVLLFALIGSQTSSGYRILFDHWLRAGVAQKIRDRLQMVAAMVPELAPSDYLADMREWAYDLFQDRLYDQIQPKDTQGWNFDIADDTAPHHPWAVRWHRGFAALRTLHGRLSMIEDTEIRSVFGDLIARIVHFFAWDDGYPQHIDCGTF